MIPFCLLRRLAWSAAVLLSFALTTPATLVRAESSATLTIRLYNSAGIPQSELQNGRQVAESLLGETGLRPVFRDCGRAGADLQAGACSPSRGRSEVVVRAINAPAVNASLHPDALGVASVLTESDRGWLATVFPDRIAIAAARVRADPGTLLGRVIAHEIGHLLLGVSYHGDAGLMRAEWTHDRLVGNAAEWRFSIDEAARMQQRLESAAF